MPIDETIGNWPQVARAFNHTSHARYIIESAEVSATARAEVAMRSWEASHADQEATIPPQSGIEPQLGGMRGRAPRRTAARQPSSSSDTRALMHKGYQMLARARKARLQALAEQ